LHLLSSFPEGAFAEGGDPLERAPGRWRIDADLTGSPRRIDETHRRVRLPNV
jgi:hypothetical protein